MRDMTIANDFSLSEMRPVRSFAVAVDSDGCVFDVMGIKQRECFCPMMIAYFGLQPVAEAARECKMFADLYSNTRGANRHITMARILTELLPSHPRVTEIGFTVPQFEHYIEWANHPDSILSDAGLKQAMDAARNSEQRSQLQTALTWSRRVNELVAEVVHSIPPFKWVRECLAKAGSVADIVVCSATPVEALQREWGRHDLLQYVSFVAGQEMGSKAQQLAILKEKYGRGKIIMVGDALGDLDAARQNDISFYPINPGGEVESWKMLHDEAFDRFIQARYVGAYGQEITAEFDKSLPAHPSWLQKSRDTLP